MYDLVFVFIALIVYCPCCLGVVFFNVFNIFAHELTLGKNRRGNQEWIIQRLWWYLAHKTQNEDKKKENKVQFRKLKRWATRIPNKKEGWP